MIKEIPVEFNKIVKVISNSSSIQEAHDALMKEFGMDDNMARDILLSPYNEIKNAVVV